MATLFPVSGQHNDNHVLGGPPPLLPQSGRPIPPLQHCNSFEPFINQQNHSQNTPISPATSSLSSPDTQSSRSGSFPQIVFNSQKSQYDSIQQTFYTSTANFENQHIVSAQTSGPQRTNEVAPRFNSMNAAYDIICQPQHTFEPNEFVVPTTVSADTSHSPETLRRHKRSFSSRNPQLFPVVDLRNNAGNGHIESQKRSENTKNLTDLDEIPSTPPNICPQRISPSNADSNSNVAIHINEAYIDRTEQFALKPQNQFVRTNQCDVTQSAVGHNSKVYDQPQSVPSFQNSHLHSQQVQQPYYLPQTQQSQMQFQQRPQIIDNTKNNSAPRVQSARTTMSESTMLSPPIPSSPQSMISSSNTYNQIPNYQQPVFSQSLRVQNQIKAQLPNANINTHLHQQRRFTNQTSVPQFSENNIHHSNNSANFVQPNPNNTSVGSPQSFAFAPQTPSQTNSQSRNDRFFAQSRTDSLISGIPESQNNRNNVQFQQQSIHQQQNQTLFLQTHVIHDNPASQRPPSLSQPKDIPLPSNPNSSRPKSEVLTKDHLVQPPSNYHAIWNANPPQYQAGISQSNVGIKQSHSFVGQARPNQSVGFASIQRKVSPPLSVPENLNITSQSSLPNSQHYTTMVTPLQTQTQMQMQTNSIYIPPPTINDPTLNNIRARFPPPPLLNKQAPISSSSSTPSTISTSSVQIRNVSNGPTPSANPISLPPIPATALTHPTAHSQNNPIVVSELQSLPPPPPPPPAFARPRLLSGQRLNSKPNDQTNASSNGSEHMKQRKGAWTEKRNVESQYAKLWELTELKEERWSDIMNDFIATERDYNTALSSFISNFFPQLDFFQTRFEFSFDHQQKLRALLTHLSLLRPILENHHPLSNLISLPIEHITIECLIQAFGDFPANVGAYNCFCGNEENVANMLVHLRNELPELAKLLDECNHVCSSCYVFEDFLAFPFNRVFFYPILFYRLLYSFRSTQHYESLKTAYQGVLQRVSAIRDVKWEAETCRKFSTLIKTIDGLPTALFKKSLRFLIEGDVVLEPKNLPPQNCYLFLFNDLLLICDASKAALPKFFRGSLEVERLIVSDESKQELNRFVLRLSMNEQVNSSQESTVFTDKTIVFGSKQEKNEWLELFVSAINQQFSSTVEDVLFSSLIDISTLQFSEPPIGEGTSGVVYRGIYMNDKEVAIKKIKHISILSSADKASFIREVALSRMFSCSHIVEFYGCVISPTNLLIVNEYVPHGNLKAYLFKNTNISLVFKLRCMLDAVLGISYLHHHYIMHRDVKTENALVCSFSLTAPSRIKLTDFGASKVMKNRFGRTQTRIGTPIYVSPEVMRGEPYGFSTDIYSLGIMMWEIMEQREPYEHLKDSSVVMFSVCVRGERPPLLPGHFPPALRSLINNCWDNDPNKRPTIGTVVSELNGIVNSDDLVYN